MIVAPGSTSVSVDVFFADDTGAAVTGKVAADFPACKWSGGDNTADTAITLSDLAAITTAHPNNNTAGGVKEREGGVYRLDLPNNMFTSAGRKTLTFAESANKRIIAPNFDAQYIQGNLQQWLGVAPLALASQKVVADAGTFPSNFSVLSIDATGLVGAIAVKVGPAGAATSQTAGDLYPAIQGIGTATGAAVNVDAATDNASGGIPGVTSATTKVGTQTNTFASAVALDGVYHVISGTATALDWVYRFNTGGGTTPVGLVWTGYVNSANDVVTIYVWNHVGAVWELIGTIQGNAGTVNLVKNLALFPRHRGTSTAELGKVYLRFACSGMTNPTLSTDQLYVTYAVTSRTAGYANGAIWVDTVNGVAGTEPFVNGTADNPTNSLANALALSAAVGLKKFVLASNSAITLTSSLTGYSLDGGSGAAIALGGQDIAASFFRQCLISGIATSSGIRPVFQECRIGDVTLPPCLLYNVAMAGTLLMGAAGDYLMIGGSDAIPSSVTPVIDFVAAVGPSNFTMHDWNGGVEFRNMLGADFLSIDGVGKLVFASSCTGGERRVRGAFEIVDGSTGMTRAEAANVTLPAFFLIDSGSTYASAVNGSVVKEIASNSSGGTAPTAAQIATAVFTDLLASSDFSTSASFGKLVKDNLDTTVSSRLAPTTAGRTLDVSLGGEAGVDWANVGSPYTPVGLTATSIDPVGIQSALGVPFGDLSAQLGAIAANVMASFDMNSNLATALELDSGNYRFTTAALANAPTGGSVPTVDQIATAVWTDLLAGSDFSTLASIGKLLKDDVNATVSSRMAEYTQPAGFLAATFPTIVASTTNITSGTLTTVGTLTNPPPDSAGVTTLLDRLGAFAGSGLNTVLGFFRALFRAESPPPSDIGGTYDPLTASLEALHFSFAAAGTLDNQTTILSRLGPFSATSTNNVFGFMQAMMRADVGTPSDLTGTNYDPAFDSLEAISAAASGGGGGGTVDANIVSINGTTFSGPTVPSDRVMLSGVLGDQSAGSAGVVILPSGPATLNTLVGARLRIVSGTGQYQERTITGWNATLKYAGLDWPCITQPAAGDTYQVLYDNAPQLVTDGSSVAVTVYDFTAGALAKFFTLDSTKVYADAVDGSVVKEIAANAGGSAPTTGDIDAALSAAHGGGSWATATSVAVIDKTGFSLASDGLDGILVETGLNARQALAIGSAVLAGVLSGAGTATITMLGAGVTTPRVIATVDAANNRTNIVLMPPA